MRTLIRSAFAAAQDNGLCVRNPALNLTSPPKRQPQRKAFTAGEASAIIEYAMSYKIKLKHATQREAGKRIAVGIITLLYTGMRRGELLGLQWGDLHKDKVYIRRGVYIEGGSPRVTDYQAKSEDSIREIPIPEFLHDLISDSIPKRSMFVFCTTTGTLTHPRHFNRGYDIFFKHLLKEHPDVRELSVHCCRHTYATLTLTGGADIRVVQTLLGHANINTTAIYTHPDFLAKQNALDGMVKLISQDTKQDIKPSKAIKSPINA